MRITTSTGLCAAIVAMTAAFATAQAPNPQNNSSSSDKKTVVTGCLRQGPSAATDPAPESARGGGPPAAASSPAPAQFVLENATESAPADQSSKGGSAQTYQLIANPTALAPHAGKKLELTGTLEPAAGASAPTLRVESGKIVAASCTQ
jgi:hypothetical protein